MTPKWKEVLKFDTEGKKITDGRTYIREVFMVNGDVWEEAGGEHSLPRYATMGEIEKTLGRKLNHRDFMFLPINFETEEGYGSVRKHLGDNEYGNLLEYYSDRNNQRKNQEENGGTSRYGDRETRKAFANALEYFK